MARKDAAPRFNNPVLMIDDLARFVLASINVSIVKFEAQRGEYPLTGKYT